VRNTGSGHSRRNQPIETYFAAVKEVIASGGWVIRVGDNSMKKFPDLERFIDLAVSNQDLTSLHLYALARAKFFIGTTSGPASIPPLFGVPSLVTNATSIGRNALSSSENSIYIPKKIIDNRGRPLSYSEALNSVDGFGELEISELREFNLALECNSEEDILLGTRELMARVEGNFKNDNNSMIILNQIRNTFPHAARGLFAQSFIDRNPKWLS
jgi:putative glycosyltransferase (TIGR04372 family)